MMQSLGGSATVGLSYGIIGDIITPAERGQWMSIAACGPNVTPALGPVFGGILAEKAGWPYIFWFLIILAGVGLALIILLYPETSRKIVGNGSIPARGVNKRLIDLCPPLSSPLSADPLVVLSQRKRLRFPNPFLSITLFLSPHNTPIMLIYGLFYTDYCVLQASLSTLFINNYHYSTLVAGLTYIPFGAGCFLAALFGGRILNRDYRITAAKHGCQKVDKVVGDDLLKFPIVEARLRSMPATITLTAACMIPFGFLLEHELHPAGPLALQFALGALTTFTFTIGNTMLVDLHPKRPATAQASVNLVRCAMAGGGLAALQPLINAVGPGWCFVIFAGLTLSGLGFWWIEMRWGLEWWMKSMDAKI
jgi:predicted MFS family arabinose efflux permease